MTGQTPDISYIPLPGGATEFESGAAGGGHTFWHKDWLGSVRLASTVNNRAIAIDRAFAPFGETYDPVIGSSTAQENFTGDTKSAELE